MLDEPQQTAQPATEKEEPLISEEESAPYEAPALQSEMIVVCDHFSEADKALLSKILAAVKVDMNDVAMVEGAPQQALECRRLLVFGDLQVPETGKELYAATPEAKWLRATSLRQLAASQEEKMKLWSALKTWFGLG